MIYSLRKKFIKISMLSVAAVLAVIYLLVAILSQSQMDQMMDALTDIIADNGGRFPEWEKKPGRPPFGIPDFMGPDTAVSTRFFTAWCKEDGTVLGVDTKSVSSISERQAMAYASQVNAGGKERGWLSQFRYKRFETPLGYSIVFVDGGMNQAMEHRFLLTIAVVFFVSALAILILILIFSQKAVAPVAESYHKQKQFITDANHELKTPLTLILTNLEILESEYGKNEWLDDVRAEGQRMAELVNQLITLTRMDEEPSGAAKENFNISEALLGLLSGFRGIFEEQGMELQVQVEPGVEYEGEAQAICQLFSILLDNAWKYCDENGSISVFLEKKRGIEIRIENSFADVGQIRLDLLFERFYRADQARSAGGFGIGLSVAKAIVGRHKGEIKAYQAGKGRIGFLVSLK